MARRRTSSRRSSTRSPSSSHSSRRGSAASPRAPRLGRDGKLEIHCPQCSALYRMPEDLLEDRFDCRKCGRSFFPKAVIGRRRRPRNQAKPFIIGGVVLVAMILLGVVISSVAAWDTRAHETVRVAAPSPAAFDARRDNVLDWVRSVQIGDDFNFGRLTDLGALQAQMGVWPEQPFASLSSDKHGELKKALVAAFPEHEQGAFFTGLILDMAVHDDMDKELGDEGTITVRLHADPKSKSYRGKCRIKVHYRMADALLKVHGFTVDMKPQIRLKRSKGLVTHDKIAAPEKKQITVEGRTIDVTESPLIPLEHLEDTPAALRKQIDDSIEKMIDMNAPGGQSNRMIRELKKIGRPAIPRILNRIYQLHGDMEGNRDQITQLVQALRDMTGNANSYHPANSVAVRLSALRQWYAFWYRYHKGEYDELIQKGDDVDLLAPDPPKKDDADKKKQSPQ